MTEFSHCKLEIFLPPTHLAPLQEALAQADAGHIGSYDRCLSYAPVTSCWRPLAGTRPLPGRPRPGEPGDRAQGGGHLPAGTGGGGPCRGEGGAPL